MPCICSHLHRDRSVANVDDLYQTSCAHEQGTWPAVLMLVGTINGRGYDGQQNDVICDVCGPCQMIWSTFKLVFRWFQLIGYAYGLLRCLDVEIWWFLWWQWRLWDRPITLLHAQLLILNFRAWRSTSRFYTHITFFFIIM